MRLALPALLALPLCLLAGRRDTVNLNGEWQIADSIEPLTLPNQYPARVPVPGLANLAQPAFPDVDKFDSREFIDTSIREKKLPESARVDHAGVSLQARNYFWYRRTFTAPARRQRAFLRVNKAQFGTAVWLNGLPVGEHLGCFTAGIFDLTPALKWAAENEVVIRVGAHPAAVPVWAPAGTDFEKYKWTPGIYDSVFFHAADAPLIESVQVAPKVSPAEALVETRLHNPGPAPLTFPLTHRAGAITASQQVTLAPGERKAVTARLRFSAPRLWTPEQPNLYTLVTETPGDALTTRFGLREFRFDTATKRAYLNGKLYFLRGSNITLHRFFEDPLCKRLPWDEKWVRRLLTELPKQMSWNSFRLCIGPVPDFWLDIADETGLLLQNEFFIWNGRTRFPPYRADELLTQYTEWVRDNANHPSVALWDASNETDAPVLRDVVIPQIRKLDLSNRPWDNGYAVPTGPDDPVEDHPYLFSRIHSGRDFDMRELEQMTGAKTTNAGHPSAHATIVNEYGWLWLRRDGEPTLLTERVYEKLLGKDATPRRRQELYAYLLAGLTEFWRAHRNFAGVLHFTWLTCSYPGVKTGDHWADVEKLDLEPNFKDWVTESFRPLGVYVNFWQPELTKSSTKTYSIMMVNDDPVPRGGKLTLSWQTGPAKEIPFHLPPHGAHTWNLELQAPAEPGPNLLTAAAAASDLPVPTRSRRHVLIR